MTILAWHGDPALKALAVASMRAHREADDFIQGDYLEHYGGRYKGCFHGCLTAEALAAELGTTVTGLDIDAGHVWWEAGERFWGIPLDVGQLLDSVFENTDAPGEFAVAATEAIPVGADLTTLAAEDMRERWYLNEIDEAGILAAIAAAPIPATEETTNA